MSGGFRIEFSPVRGSHRRIRYESQATGEDYWRIREVWNGCRWRIQYRELVRAVYFECDGVVLK